MALLDPVYQDHRYLRFKHISKKLNQRYYGLQAHPKGYDLMARDWDTAIVLDACRYDIFASEYGQDKSVNKVSAPGSSSEEFIRRTFEGENFHNTVYVTGNPYTTLLSDKTFYDVKLDEAWAAEDKEAPPERITKAAIEAHRTYPNKRIIIHYMTPHLPFVSSKGQEVNEALGWWRGMVWPKDTSREKFREAYRENVRVAIEHMEMLVSEISGRIVVTADHGELLGERTFPIPIRMYGHYKSLYVPELIEVPWVEIKKGKRREVCAEQPIGSINVDEETKRNRLEALGYLW